MNLINAIYGFCDTNLKRRDLFLKYTNAEIKEYEKLNIIIDPLYFGYNKYRGPNNEFIKVKISNLKLQTILI